MEQICDVIQDKINYFNDVLAREKKFAPDGWQIHYYEGCVDALKNLEHHIEKYTNIEEVLEEPKEAVDHPQHYNRKGAMECIDEMRLIFGDYETAIFCKLNAYKYRYRAGSKGNAEEDLRKSDWYIKKYKELRDKPCGYMVSTTDNSNITLLSNHTKD